MNNSKKLILLLSIILIFTIATTISGYVYNKVWEYNLVSKDFHFYSDHLNKTSLENVNNNWDGEKVTFNLRNYKNLELITKDDIEYLISCETNKEYIDCYLNGSNQKSTIGVLNNIEYCKNTKSDGINVSSYNKINCEVSGYTWHTDPNKKNHYFELQLNDLSKEINEVEVYITAISNKPYKKELNGTFKLKKVIQDKKIDLTIKEEIDSYKVILSNTFLEERCVSISWNEHLIEEAEFLSYELTSNDYINKVTVLLEGKSSKIYTFYGDDIKVNDFTVDSDIKCN